MQISLSLLLLGLLSGSIIYFWVFMCVSCWCVCMCIMCIPWKLEQGVGSTGVTLQTGVSHLVRAESWTCMLSSVLYMFLYTNPTHHFLASFISHFSDRVFLSGRCDLCYLGTCSETAPVLNLRSSCLCLQSAEVNAWATMPSSFFPSLYCLCSTCEVSRHFTISPNVNSLKNYDNFLLTIKVQGYLVKD